MRRLAFAIIIFILALIPASLFVVLRYVSATTNTTIFHFPSIILKSFQQPSLAPGFSFVMLGVDPRDDQLEKTQVSDSIIIGRLSPNWEVRLLSIPRDLWVYSLGTKVNQIYPLAQEKVSQSESFEYIQDEFSQLTGQDISRTLILTTDNLIELTKVIGGVDITMQSTYTDEQYPNPEYIKTPSPKVPIYKTVVFPKGNLHLDETNITEFVRSRKGQNEDGTGGTDLGRIERQQLLLEALINKLKSTDFILKPSNILGLYNFWHTEVKSNISDEDILSLLLSGNKNITDISLTKSNIPVGENPKTDILYHPKTFINRQWVYIPVDKEYQGLQEYISGFLDR